MLSSTMKSPSFYVFSLLVFTLGCNGEIQSDNEKTLSLPAITDTGALQQLFDPPSAGGLDFSFYNLFTSFVNQTRSTIPKIAYHGNFTLLQLSLLGAVGAMAAGVATIVAEGKYFKDQADENEHHGQYGPPGYYKRKDNAGRINFDLPNSISKEGKTVGSTYGSQQVLSPYVYHEGNQDLFSRKKRDANDPTANNSTEESHRSKLRKRIKKKKVEATQENYAVQPSQSYEIPYEMFNSDGNYISADNQITPTQSPYYVTINNTENKNKSKSPKVLTSGNYPKDSSSTEKNGYYVNLEQQNPTVGNSQYDANYFQQLLASQQSSNKQTNSLLNQNSQTDTQSNYVNLIDSDTNYKPSQQDPSVNLEYFQPQNNQQIQSNFPGSYYQNSNGPTSNSNSNSAGQSNTNQLYYRNQSQNSPNTNDPNYYYYAANNAQVPNGVFVDNMATVTPNPSVVSQVVNSQNQYQNFQRPSSDQQTQTQYQEQPQQQYPQQVPTQYPQQQPPAQYPQQQYLEQQPQQQFSQNPQQQFSQNPQQQYPQQPQQNNPQQYPQQPQQQYPQQPQQQYTQQSPQTETQYLDQSQQYLVQQSQQQIPTRAQSSQKYQVEQSQQSPSQIQAQPPQQYPNQQPQQGEGSYLQEMKPPLPPNSQNSQPETFFESVPPSEYYQYKGSSSVRFPVQQPTQNPYKKNNNRNGQVSRQTPYYMTRPYANVNSNKRNSYKNYILPSIPETTTQSLLSKIFNPFGLSFPPKNKNSNFISRTFKSLNRNRVKRVN